jgi:geranylgeranyl diphosphate synthase type I
LATTNNLPGRYASDLKRTIKEALKIAPPFIQGVISYHFGWVDQNFQPANFETGKILRPTLCLLVFEALTGGYEAALPAAAAIEMIHNFSLIHDDIEDSDLERRGRPTAWAIWGKPLAINIGDYLYTLAFKCLYQLDTARFAPETIFSVLRLVNEACLSLTAGQDLDLRFEQLQAVSTDMYLDMVYKKTGALLEAAILSGALLGTTNAQIIENYQEFARNIGTAFQVRDDILGIWGDSARTGKSTDNDLRRKKKTLPVIYVLNEAPTGRRDQLHALYAMPEPLSDDQVKFVRESLEQVNAYQYAQDVAGGHIEKAFTALDRIAISNRAHSELETISKFLVNRTY